jgi:hypothetical protein
MGAAPLQPSRRPSMPRMMKVNNLGILLARLFRHKMSFGTNSEVRFDPLNFSVGIIGDALALRREASAPSRSLVPTANPKQLTVPNLSIVPSMSDLCRLIWYALIELFCSRAGLEAENLGLRHQLNVLRHNCPKSGAQQHRPAAACWALSPSSRGPGSFENHKARDTDALAPRTRARQAARFGLRPPILAQRLRPNSANFEQKRRC